MGVAIEGAEAPVGGAESCLEALGDGRRYHVHGSPGGEGTVLHLATPLEHFDSVHAGDVGEVVGGRGSVMGGGSEDPVFHQGDTFASLGLRPSKADIGAQAVAVFFVDVHARHGTEHSADIGVAELDQFLWRKVVSRTGTVARFELAPEHLPCVYHDLVKASHRVPHFPQAICLGYLCIRP